MLAGSRWIEDAADGPPTADADDEDEEDERR